ncbi:MAG: sigma-54-dependent Fis family transcriptional regulator [Bacteroidetes bacterium]|nr:sigma-54-dependent Fis family transcriptional regulator [Bacteroidota bacterium]
MLLKNSKILIIDDDTDVLTAVKLLLKQEAKEVVTEKNPENILNLLSKNHFDLILLDMNFNSSVNTGNEGFFWLRKIKESGVNTMVVMITAYGDIDLAVRSVKEGASDFIVKPWHNERLITSLGELLKGKKKLNQQINDSKEKSSAEIITESSEAMQDILYKIQKVAPTEANILILGENGTGKDLAARAIHDQSIRKDGPFIKVDMGALTESLFESELFGHKKGAFTGASEDRAGRFEAAQGGTLFLDEIGNISLQQQSKLLSVLQNRQINRIGSNEIINIDIRLICATNLPLHLLANENRFRKDLIYRINTVDILMPALRNRGDDIILLANHFLKVYAAKYSKPLSSLTQKTKEKLKDYPYPGNVRELQYAMERAVIMSEGNELLPQDILFSQLEGKMEIPEQNNSNLGQLEKKTILKVIEKNNGNITKAAQELGLTRTALYRRLNKYEI